MYIGFELKEFDKGFFDDLDYYLDIGNKIASKHKRIVQDTLGEFKQYDGTLNGDKMQSKWFPQIDADIFLSHSHLDKELVIAFAGWLKSNFNLKVFIDSCIWGYSKKLQSIIDNKYSRNKEGILGYDNVLYASSHVNMMLNTALMQMIDSCECIMFINTPNSVKPREVVDKIISPWIYSEIGMTKLIKKKILSDYRLKSLNESTEVFSDLPIEYNLDTKHLIKLEKYDLHKWEKSFIEHVNFSDYPLDYLYKLKK